MGDLVKIFSEIGKERLDSEVKIKNSANSYDTILCWIWDIKSQTLEPNFNIPKGELIISRFGTGANSGNLFPNVHLDIKTVKTNFVKFEKSVLKAVKNMLLYFDKKEIEESEILTSLKNLNSKDFQKIKDEILAQEEAITSELKNRKSDKSKKVALIFSLGFEGRVVSGYFKDIFKRHLEQSIQITPTRGYDIITNEDGVGADASLPFCSTNEMMKSHQSIKYRLLPLNQKSAIEVKIGYDTMMSRLSFNFFGLKMTILPTMLIDDRRVFNEVLDILESAGKNESIQEIEEREILINEELESVAKKEADLPVLNTILFYKKQNSAVEPLLQIDDIFPSYISEISQTMLKYKIQAFYMKDNAKKEFIYLNRLFEDRLDVISILLSPKKISKDNLVKKFSEIIYWGNVDKEYGSRIKWDKYFNGFYSDREIKAINRYLNLFRDTKKLKEDFILQKDELELDSLDTKERLEALLKDREFLTNDTLKSAYLLGVLANALMNWQYGVSGKSSFAKWLNNFGVISKDRLDRLWKKEEETARKLASEAKTESKKVNLIKEVLIEYLAKSLNSNERVKSSYVSLSFAMGGEDYKKLATKKDDKKGDDNE